jgi:hypothetical protein
MQTDWICKRLAAKSCSELLQNKLRNILCVQYGFKKIWKEGKQNNTTESYLFQYYKLFYKSQIHDNG